MRILFAGGGTAGHINPALAVARYAKEQGDKDILFIGKRGNMEETLVKKDGFDIEFIDIEGFKRSLSPRNFMVIYKMFKAVGDCKKIIKRFKPDVIISTGGYIGGPVMVAAKKLGVPAIIHEQNVYPGMAVKMSAKQANFIATSFEQTASLTKFAKKCVFTGNPVRHGLLMSDYKTARAVLGIDEKPFVVAFGGSLGAEKINDAMVGYIKLIQAQNTSHLLFATGTRNYDWVMTKLKEEKISLENNSNIQVVPYIYNMDEAMAASDVVVSRAGAITISEITALGKASILIPSPNVTRNQQVDNANVLKARHAAVVVEEEKLTPGHLKDEIEKLIFDKEYMAQICGNAKAMGVTNATEKIYDLAKKLI